MKEVYKTGNPSEELGQKAAELHKKWITFCWGYYNPEAYVNLTQMYVDYERFRVYYDKEQPGCAEFLRDAIWIYTGMKK